MIESALVTLIQQDADLAKRLGGRVQPATDPTPRDGAGRRELPRLTYQRVGTPRTRTNDGPAGIASARVDVKVWADTLLAAKELAGRVRVLLDGLSRPVTTMGGRRVDVRSMAVTDEHDVRGAASDDAGEKPPQGVLMELRAQWVE